MRSVLRPDRRTLLIVAASTAITAGLVALTLGLGGWAYQTRSGSLHDGRLQRLLDQQPTADQVREGVLAEPGNRLLPTPATEEALRTLVEGWSPLRVEEVTAKRRRWPGLLIFAVRDVVYLVYFDAEGKMRDYVLLTDRRP